MNANDSSGKTANFRPILIGMIVASSLPLLLTLFGLTFGPTVPLALSILHNGFVIGAAAITLRSTNHYWLTLAASILTFLGWFWLGFTPVYFAVVLFGTFISVGIGTWAFLTLRKPDSVAAFANQTDPITPALRTITTRIPKLSLKPTEANANKVAVTGLIGVCLMGFVMSGMASLFTEIAKDMGPSEREKYMQRTQHIYGAHKPQLEEADKLWDAGKKAEAVDLYTGLISVKCPHFLYQEL
jgi:hypothetical protein